MMKFIFTLVGVIAGYLVAALTLPHLQPEQFRDMLWTKFASYLAWLAFCMVAGGSLGYTLAYGIVLVKERLTKRRF